MKKARRHEGTEARREEKAHTLSPSCLRALVPACLSSFPIYLLLASYLLIVVYPMFWLFYTSLKADRDIFLHPFALPDPSNLRWDNYGRAWTDGRFDRYFFNSILITSTTVIATTFLAAMTAYALSRFVFPGARAIYFYFWRG